MCTRADAKTTELEPTGKHGVLYYPTEAHDDTTAHDKTAHDTTAHDTTAHDTVTNAPQSAWDTKPTPLTI